MSSLTCVPVTDSDTNCRDAKFKPSKVQQDTILTLLGSFFPQHINVMEERKEPALAEAPAPSDPHLQEHAWPNKPPTAPETEDVWTKGSAAAIVQRRRSLLQVNDFDFDRHFWFESDFLFFFFFV